MTSPERGDNASKDAPADDRLDKVAAELISRGLHVNIPVDEPLSPGNPDADFIWVRNPASGQYAQVSYAISGPRSADVSLELTYRTAPDKDPDGAHMADRLARLLSAADTQPGDLTDRLRDVCRPGPPDRFCRVMERSPSVPERPGIAVGA